MHATGRTLGLLLLALALCAPARGEEGAPDVPADVVKALERAVDEAAKGGRRDAVEEVLEVLVRLGRPADAVDGLRAGAAKRLERARRREAVLPRAAKELSRAAEGLAAGLETLEGEARARRAGLVLRLDADLEAAHVARGHVRHEGAWVTAGMPAALAARAEIAEVLRRVRRLEVEVEASESALPLFPEAFGRAGHVAAAGPLSVHSAEVSPERVARVCRESVRAAALLWWALTGELAVPPTKQRVEVALVHGNPSYEKALRSSVEHGGMSAEKAAEDRQITSYWDPRRYLVVNGTTEAAEESICLYQLFEKNVGYGLLGGLGEPALSAGLVNWVCLQHLGTRAPGVTFTDTEETPGREGRTVGRRDPAERREMLRFPEAGLAGTRAWIAYLVRGGEDPPWAHAMRDQIGRIQGNDLLKATVIVDYLLETGELAALWKATKAGTEATAVERFEAALRQPLAAFEARWRDWLLPLEPGLVQRLERAPKEPDPEVARLLSTLDRIRRAAFETRAERLFFPLRADEELSAGCVAHAEYLARHPEQAQRWPDAHEEYPDREGFSAAGARAGLASVVAPGVAGAEEAVVAWMATLYHRLPLLEPGLVRIGWGHARRCAVLDCASLCAPPPEVAEVRWPHDGMKDVPLRFEPELPNPVPGEEQSRWGYPVTLQLWHFAPEPQLVLRLFEGGREVACHMTTPEAPTNPYLVPRGTYALIPKAALKAKTTYAVRVEGYPGRPDYAWTFTTGGR